MSTKTTNYGLTKPDGNEYYDIAVPNANMDKIDEALNQHDNTLALKAPLASPKLTGTPTAPTAAQGTNSTQISTTAFVAAAISAIINNAPSNLNTLAKIANDLMAHKGNNVAHMTQTQKNQLAAAVQSATFGGTAVPKSGTELTIPMPTAAQVGAFPKTTILSNDTDLDTVTTPAPYCGGNGNIIGSTHAPMGSYAFSLFVLSTGAFGGDGVIQTFTDYYSRKTFVRANYYDTAWHWYDWVDIADGGHASTADNATNANYASSDVAPTSAALRNIQISTAEATSYLGSGVINIVIE